MGELRDRGLAKKIAGGENPRDEWQEKIGTKKKALNKKNFNAPSNTSVRGKDMRRKNSKKEQRPNSGNKPPASLRKKPPTREAQLGGEKRKARFNNTKEEKEGGEENEV